MTSKKHEIFHQVGLDSATLPPSFTLGTKQEGLGDCYRAAIALVQL